MAHAFTLQFVKHLFLVFFDLNVPNERIGLRLEVDRFILKLVCDAQLDLTLENDLRLALVEKLHLYVLLGEQWADFEILLGVGICFRGVLKLV